MAGEEHDHAMQTLSMNPATSQTLAAITQFAQGEHAWKTAISSGNASITHWSDASRNERREMGKPSKTGVPK